MEHALVLYLNTRGLPLEREAELEAARRSGLGIVLAAPAAAPYKHDHLEYIIEVPIGAFDEAEKLILAYLHAHRISVQGIVAWTDKEVELVARLGARLGLRTSSIEAVHNVRNKANTRRCLAKVPAANPKFTILRDECDFMTALTTIGVPCRLKPAGASGGRGQFQVPSEEEALAIFREFRQYCRPERDEMYAYYADEFLLEEQLSGSEHSVAGIVRDGTVHVLAITDKKVQCDIALQYQSTTPTALPNDMQQQVIAMARAAVEAVGIDYCGFHVDLMVAADGPKVLEVGGRLGGECINSHLIPLAVPPIKPYDLLLQVVKGGNPFSKEDYTKDATRRAGFRHLLPPGPGRLKRIAGIEHVKQHPNVRVFYQARQVGDRVVYPRQAYNAFALGYVVAACELEQDINLILDEIATLVTVEVEEC